MPKTGHSQRLTLFVNFELFSRFQRIARNYTKQQDALRAVFRAGLESIENAWQLNSTPTAPQNEG